jgi:type II secretory ATPase GspE/PulE/Tfp pilus assembly ATPase PilB-like protein
MEVFYRIDGVLQLAGELPKSLLPNVVARLKLLANMITYRTDIPQEGRILESGGDVEKRVSTFPTHFGEKVVIRMFGGISQFQRLEDLGLPEEIRKTLAGLLNETSGAILFAGPAGSGKTTTLYTCLRELSSASRGGRSLMTLEDPIEMLVPGVAQAQINQAAGLDLAVGLRSMMRQDPEVIGVGEIRDLATAEVAFQASLTGHLLLCTFHAGSAAGVIGRLSEMGIEPYVIISGVRAIVCQRLLRRLCTCARPTEEPVELLGIDVPSASVAVGCPQCRGTGYRGRVMLAEILIPNSQRMRRAIRAHADVVRLEQMALRSGMVGLAERARHAVEAGLTDPAEYRRVLGIFSSPIPSPS